MLCDEEFTQAIRGLGAVNEEQLRGMRIIVTDPTLIWFEHPGRRGQLTPLFQFVLDDTTGKWTIHETVREVRRLAGNRDPLELLAWWNTPSIRHRGRDTAPRKLLFVGADQRVAILRAFRDSGLAGCR